MPAFDSVYDTAQIGLDRDDLDERVEARVAAMMAAGLLDEVRGTAAATDCARAQPPARRSAMRSCCASSTTPVPSSASSTVAVAETVRATRRFVRRQRSWFRRDPRVRWLDAADRRLPDMLIGVLRPS